MKHILTLITSLIISSIIFLNGLNGQGLPVDDFSLPICRNADGETDTLYFHNDYFDTTEIGYSAWILDPYYTNP